MNVWKTFGICIEHQNCRHFQFIHFGVPIFLNVKCHAFGNALQIATTQQAVQWAKLPYLWRPYVKLLNNFSVYFLLRSILSIGKVILPAMLHLLTGWFRFLHPFRQYDVQPHDGIGCIRKPNVVHVALQLYDPKERQNRNDINHWQSTIRNDKMLTASASL